MKTCLLFCCLLLSVAACEQEPAQDALDTSAAGPVTGMHSLDYREVPQHLLSLTTTEEVDSLELPLEKNLFGKFFADRVAFFIIKQPTNRLHNAQVKSLTLYYLDGRLSQIKYSLQQDVLDDLIRKHGSFRITGYDSLSQALIKANQVVSLQQKEVTFNKKLNNFALKWDLERGQIVYKVNRHNALEPFHYIERLKGFEATYRSIRSLDGQTR